MRLMTGQKVWSALIIFAHLRLSWSSGCGPCSGMEGPWCVGVRGQLMEGLGSLTRQVVKRRITSGPSAKNGPARVCVSWRRRGETTVFTSRRDEMPMLKGHCSRRRWAAHVVLILYHKSGWKLEKNHPHQSFGISPAGGECRLRAKYIPSTRNVLIR